MFNYFRKYPGVIIIDHYTTIGNLSLWEQCLWCCRTISELFLDILGFAEISTLHRYKISNHIHCIYISSKNLAKSGICNAIFSSQHMLLLGNNIAKLVWLRYLFIAVPHAYYIFCQITNNDNNKHSSSLYTRGINIEI